MLFDNTQENDNNFHKMEFYTAFKNQIITL
jgi:hypothetical protein